MLENQDQAVKAGHEGAVKISAMIDWFQANGPGSAAQWADVRHRLHEIAGTAEELAGVPYGTFLAGGTDKPPHP